MILPSIILPSWILSWMVLSSIVLSACWAHLGWTMPEVWPPKGDLV